jgi:hypothetical protein
MATTPNLGLTIPVGGTTPGATNNTTPGTYPYIEAVNLELIDSLVYSANNPPPGPSFTVNVTFPTTGGPYALGAIVWNSNPIPGGIVGWVCTTAGSPGTWKAFGPISP